LQKIGYAIDPGSPLDTVPWTQRIPFSIIGRLIIVMCLTGAYTVANSLFDAALALVFGVVGYVFKKLDYPCSRSSRGWGGSADSSLRGCEVFALVVSASGGPAATQAPVYLLIDACTRSAAVRARVLASGSQLLFSA
jgi:hypothetical protein